MRYKGKEELEQAIENRTLKYMPFRFVVAILITIAKILALVFLTAFLCVKIKYFYILVVLITILFLFLQVLLVVSMPLLML